MILKCEHYDGAFEGAAFVGYCPQCVAWFKEDRKIAHAAQNPMPGVHCDGKFVEEDRCPRTVNSSAATRGRVCGLCGSEDLEPGYGFAGGFGLGMYTFCCGCDTVLDFSEDSGE